MFTDKAKFVHSICTNRPYGIHLTGRFKWCIQNDSYEITINGFQVRKINEIINVIFGLRYGTPSSLLRPKLGCSPMIINISRPSRSSTGVPYLIKLTNEIPVPLAWYASIYLPVFFKNVDFESPLFISLFGMSFKNKKLNPNRNYKILHSLLCIQ